MKKNAILQTAINGESTAAQKYEQFAHKARKDGFENIGYLFDTLVRAEKIHISRHKNALGQEFTAELGEFDVGTTIENVSAGIEGELYEYNEMYKKFEKELKKIKPQSHEIKVAKLSVTWARNVEKTHAELLQMAKEAISQGKDLDIKDLYVCKVCGNVVIGKPTENCKICGHDPQFYFESPKGVIAK